MIAALRTGPGCAFLRVAQTFNYHKRSIQAIAGDATGRWLISGCAGGTVQMKDLRSEAKPLLLDQGNGPVSFAGYLAANKFFVTGTDSGSMKLWDRDGKMVKLGSHPNRVTRAFQTIFSTWVGEERLGIRTHLGSINGIVETSSDSSFPMLVSGSQDGTIRAWKPQDPDSYLCKVGEHKGPVYGLVACNEDSIASSSEDGTIQIWNPLTSRSLKTLTHGGRVTDLLFLPNQNILLSRNDSNVSLTVKAWDFSSSKMNEIHSWADDAPSSQSDARRKKSFEDFNLVVQQSLKQQVSETAQKKISEAYHLAMKQFSTQAPDLRVKHIRSWAAFKDGTVALGYQNGQINLWNHFNQKMPILSTVPETFTSCVKALTVLADGSLVSGSEDGTIRRWVWSVKPIEVDVVVFT